MKWILNLFIRVAWVVAVSLFVTTYGGCKKDNSSEIPNVPVSIDIYPSLPQYSNLNAVGGWIYVSEGYKGIVVYRKNTDEFVALERACTYEPTKSCEIVNVEPSGLILTDDCCGSQFQIIDGTVIKAPASRSLKQYRTFWDGTLLRVTN